MEFVPRHVPGERKRLGRDKRTEKFLPPRSTCKKSVHPRLCAQEPWFSDEKKHSVEFENHRAFMDNGDRANFKWLDEQWGHARFVLNQRALQPWLLSRFDMMKEDRLNGGCSPIGDKKSCTTGKLSETGEHTTFVDNDESSMRQWVLDVAESQKNIKKYVRH